MSIRLQWVGVFAAALFLSIGCGYGQYQTAKTVPKGSYRITMAQQIQANKDLSERKISVGNFPPDIMVRVGVGDRVDVGANLFLAGGLRVDTKVNLLSKFDRPALAVSAGLGGAADWMNPDDIMAVMELPVRVIFSYRIGRGFSPYVGLGYGMFWIFGKDDLDIPPPEDPNTDYVDRKGYGDHVVKFTVGFEYKFNIRFGFMMEYSYWLPTVNDPGDSFVFVPNHMGGVGFVF